MIIIERRGYSSNRSAVGRRRSRHLYALVTPAVVLAAALCSPSHAENIFSNFGPEYAYRDWNAFPLISEANVVGRPSRSVAFQFWTPNGSNWQFEEFKAPFQDWYRQTGPFTVNVLLRKDDVGTPGAILDSLTYSGPLSGNTGEPSALVALTSMSNPTLKGGTRYWIEASVPTDHVPVVHWNVNSIDMYGKNHWVEAGQVSYLYGRQAAFSLVGTSESAPKLTTLFLDFGTDVQADFYVKTSLFSNKQYIARGEGVESAATFFDPQRAEIVSGVQDIFDRSNIPIFVTDVKPTGKALRVQFANPLPYFSGSGDGLMNGRLLGKAWDVTPSWDVVGSVDRFDRRKDGNVAVFMSPAVDELSEIIKTTAHEAAHGYGARHIDATNCAEVMESPACFDGSSPSFSQEVLDITDFASGQTHNPAYHMRRYMAEQDHADIGLPYGTYDAYTIERFVYSFSAADLTAPILDLNIAFDGSPGAWGEESSVETIAELFDGSSPVSFSVLAGTSFSLFGSSGDLSIVDILFLVDGQSADKSVINVNGETGLIGTGRIVKFVPDTGGYVQIGNFTWVAESVLEVPEPATAILFAAGFGVLLLRKLRA